MGDGKPEPAAVLAQAMRPLAAVLTAALLVALAGCSSPSTDDGMPSSSTTSSSPPTPTASSYTITVSDFPTASVAPGATFTFTDHIAGDAKRTSDHIGGHYGPNSTAAPSTTAYTSACIHVSGDLPGTYHVNCVAPSAAGTYYLRGHARITTGTNMTVSWWSDELSFTVA